MKNEKGITLIALIITIIVMLILVGVTINIAINGGLFETAQEATKKMGREVSKEKLIDATVGAYDSNGYFVKANVVLPEGMSWDTENSNCVIDENGEVFYIDPSNGAVLDEETEVTYKAYLSGDVGWYIIVGSDDSVYMAHDGTVVDYSVYIEGDIKDAINYIEATFSPYEGDISEYIDLIKNL